jgi:hypothetical protein
MSRAIPSFREARPLDLTQRTRAAKAAGQAAGVEKTDQRSAGSSSIHAKLARVTKLRGG